MESEFTLEQQQEIREKVAKAVECLHNFFDALADLVQRAMEQIRQIAINLARWFMKLQLLEWKIPYRIADFVSKKIYWYWAFKIGFNWFQRKFALIK